jgi:hypothetical protein
LPSAVFSISNLNNFTTWEFFFDKLYVACDFQYISKEYGEMLDLMNGLHAEIQQ